MLKTIATAKILSQQLSKMCYAVLAAHKLNI